MPGRTASRPLLVIAPVPDVTGDWTRVGRSTGSAFTSVEDAAAALMHGLEFRTPSPVLVYGAKRHVERLRGVMRDATRQIVSGEVQVVRKWMAQSSTYSDYYELKDSIDDIYDKHDVDAEWLHYGGPLSKAVLEDLCVNASVAGERESTLPTLAQLTSPLAIDADRPWPPRVGPRDALFEAAVEAIQHGDLAQIERARGFLASEARHGAITPKASLMAAADALLACAADAIDHAERFRGPGKRSTRKRSATDASARHWNVTRALMRAAETLVDTPVGRVRVPIALTRAATEGAGAATLACLEVTVHPDGIGAVTQDPRDQFITRCEPSFGAAMATAWAIARPRNCDGTWRLLRWQPLHPPRTNRRADEAYADAAVSGSSAGGAALRAWTLARDGKVEDPGLLVLLALDRDGAFASVAGIHAKVRAAAAPSAGMDTIVTVGDDRGPHFGNHSDAHRALEEADALESIHVHPL